MAGDGGARHGGGEGGETQHQASKIAAAAALRRCRNRAAVTANGNAAAVTRSPVRGCACCLLLRASPAITLHKHALYFHAAFCAYRCPACCFPRHYRLFLCTTSLLRFISACTRTAVA